jgi:hypothetical protein
MIFIYLLFIIYHILINQFIYDNLMDIQMIKTVSIAIYYIIEITHIIELHPSWISPKQANTSQ